MSSGAALCTAWASSSGGPRSNPPRFQAGSFATSTTNSSGGPSTASAASARGACLGIGGGSAAGSMATERGRASNSPSSSGAGTSVRSGCGLGGLDWAQARPLEDFVTLPEFEVLLFPPSGL